MTFRAGLLRLFAAARCDANCQKTILWETLGTFLREFTFGHVCQLEALPGRGLERAWHAGAGPGAGRLVIDVDSLVGEVCGPSKQRAGYGYTKPLIR